MRGNRAHVLRRSSSIRGFDPEEPATRAPRRYPNPIRVRVLETALTVMAVAAFLFPPTSAANVFGPCDPYAVLVGGSPVSVPSSIDDRGVDDAICALEERVLADIALDRGVAFDPLVAAEIVAQGRKEVRAQLFVKLIQAANTPAASRDAVQQGAVDWLVRHVRDVRLAQTTRALDEFERWDAERCAFIAPPGFTYTAGPGQCGGTLTSLFSGGPLPPSYEELTRYGVALSYTELGGGTVGDNLTDLSGDISNYLAAAAVAGGVVLTAVAGLAIVNAVVPIASLISAATVTLSGGGVASAVGFGFGTAVLGPAIIVLAGAVITITRGIQVFEAADIRPELETAIAIAQLTDEASLTASLSSQEGMAVALLSFATQTTTDSPAPPALAAGTSPPVGAPVLRTLLDDFALTPGPSIVYHAVGGGTDRAWLDRNWWVVDRGADGGPTEVQPVLTVLGPDGSARFVRFTGNGFVVSAFDADGTFSCPGAACVETLTFSYLAPQAGDQVLASSSFAGLPPLIDSGPTVVGAAFEGDQVALEIAAHDPEGGPVTVAWTVESDNGAGGTTIWRGSGATVNYDITRPGTHNVSAKLVNELGLASSAATSFFATATLSSQLTLTAQNPPTECTILGNVIAQVDPALLAIANPIAVQLDVDDDGTYEATSTTDASGRALLPIFVPLARGPHLLRAQTVGFATGAILEQTRELIVIDNAPPEPVEVELRYPDGSWGPLPVIDEGEPDLGLPHFEEGEEITIRARVFDRCNEPVDIYVLWGLAVPALQRLDVLEGADPGSWYEFSHSFVGNFFPAFFPAVVVAGVDAEGAVSPDPIGPFFIVDNVPPTVDALTLTAEPEHVVRLRAEVGDAAGVHELEAAVVDWGDGTESDARIDISELSGRSIAKIIADHEYADAGERTVTLRVRDNAATTTASQVVDVLGLAPVVSVLELEEGYGSRIVIGIDDPDGDGTAASVAVDWGDGTTPTSALYDGAAGGFVATHNYALADTFRVVVAAIDESGVAATDLIGSLTVSPDSLGPFELQVDRAVLATWRGNRRDNGRLTIDGVLNDLSATGTLPDHVLAGGFEIVVRDEDASFDVTVPLTDCRPRGARGLLCTQRSPRRIRATIIPENRRDPLSRSFVLGLTARRLHESETGPYVRAATSLGGPVDVTMRRGGTDATATLSVCRLRTAVALACEP